MTTIVGGKNRYVADVDDTNRLLTRAVNKTEVVDAILNGEGYALLAQNVVLTTDTESTIMIYQNDEDNDLIVFDTNISCSDSTGGTTGTVSVELNVGVGSSMTGGSGNPVTQANLIIGDPTQLENTSEVGQEGAGNTDANLGDRTYTKAGETNELDLFGVVPKGSQFIIGVIPPSGNTSMRVDITVYAYLAKSES